MREVIAAAEQVTGVQIPTSPLIEMVADAWAFAQSHPRGYSDQV